MGIEEGPLPSALSHPRRQRAELGLPAAKRVAACTADLRGPEARQTVGAPGTRAGRAFNFRGGCVWFSAKGSRPRGLAGGVGTPPWRDPEPAAARGVQPSL